MLELPELQDLERGERKMMKKENKAYDKLNLTLSRGNDEHNIEEYRELFTLSQDRNFSLNEVSNVTNFQINLLLSKCAVEMMIIILLFLTI